MTAMSATDPLRIAMWSGPRNISTAMMRAWENRGDCAVSDEPLYAHFLAHTGDAHPGRDEVIAAGETDWEIVAATLTGPVPGNQAIWYQKHMSHHLLPHIDREWIHSLTNVFLIRAPDAVIDSYLRSRNTVEAADIGLIQGARLFDEITERGGTRPPVIDADAFLAAPQVHLEALCEHLGIAFMTRMLSWPAGPRETDGAWAPYWYDTVWKSTGFVTPSQKPAIRLDAYAQRVADACRPHYEHLYRHRLRVG